MVLSERSAARGPDAEWAERDAAVVWHGFTQMASFLDEAPVVVARAEGHELIDSRGNRYLDAISSLWVTTLGHGVGALDDAVRGQLERVAHSTLLGHGNTVVVELAEALARVVPVDRPHMMFASDGAAAVEQALKMAFQLRVNEGEPERRGFLAFEGGYHGDSIGAMSLGGSGFGAEVFDPLRFPVLRAPSFADPAALGVAADLVAEHAADLTAVVMEPLVQGAGGMLMAPPAGFAELGRACREHDVLLVCDEVATGFGRTGTLFACEQAGLRPDLLCLGKGLTGGYLPMSATVASGRVFDAFLGPEPGAKAFAHGHSYGGNALAAAVALRHLQLLEEHHVVAGVADRSAQLTALLERDVRPHPAVRAVRILGLMAGVELAAPDPLLRWGRRVCAAAVRRGVLLRPLGDVVVVMPPLTIGSGELARISRVLGEAIGEVAAG